MSIYLSGVTFDEQLVSPISDASLYQSMLGDGVARGCGLSYSGSSLILQEGCLLAAGRLVRVPARQTIPITEQLSGYARLVLTVDLSKTATETAFQQAYLDVEYAASIEGFDSLTQEEINGSGTVYQAVVCVVSLGAAGITGIVQQLGRAAARPDAYALTLPAAGWESNRLVLPFPQQLGLVHILVGPAPSSQDAWSAAGIRLQGTSPGSLIWACDAAPAEDVLAQLLLFG